MRGNQNTNQHLLVDLVLEVITQLARHCNNRGNGLQHFKLELKSFKTTDFSEASLEGPIVPVHSRDVIQYNPEKLQSLVVHWLGYKEIVQPHINAGVC